tara:strand:- start:470 stop:793 length:324 start_codon:yes stop_codon:yes gene_type:complete
MMSKYYIVKKQDLSSTLPSCVQGKFFTAKFVKKDGEFRTMNCRLGVTKHLKGGKNYNATSDNITVFDLKNKGYRNIPVQRLIEITCGNMSVRNWGENTHNMIMTVAV